MSHVLYRGSNQFGRPRTHERLSCDSSSLWCSVVRVGLVGLNHPDVMSSFTTGLYPCVYYSFRRVEPLRTHEKVPYDPCFLWSSVVRRSSVGLSHPELVSSSTTGLVLCVVLWFKQDWKSWNTLNSWETILWSLFPLELIGLRRFGRVEPPHVLLHHMWWLICKM